MSDPPDDQGAERTNDHGAGLIHPPIPTGAETVPRPIWERVRDAACFAVWRATDVNLSPGHERMIAASVVEALTVAQGRLQDQLDYYEHMSETKPESIMYLGGVVASRTAVTKLSDLIDQVGSHGTPVLSECEPVGTERSAQEHVITSADQPPEGLL